MEATTQSKSCESYQGTAKGPFRHLFLSQVEQKMMLFTPIQAICALSEDPTVWEPLGLSTPRTPVPAPSHTIFFSLPPHPDPCLPLSCSSVPMAMHPPVSPRPCV